MSYVCRLTWFLMLFCSSSLLLAQEPLMWGEGRWGLNAWSKDSDYDGVADTLDAFPLDPAEWLDTDGDGIGNNADLDDDNDTLSDAFETAVGRNPIVEDYKVDAGWAHVCVLHDGGVECWGSNGSMQASPPALKNVID